MVVVVHDDWGLGVTEVLDVLEGSRIGGQVDNDAQPGQRVDPPESSKKFAEDRFALGYRLARHQVLLRCPLLIARSTDRHAKYSEQYHSLSASPLNSARCQEFCLPMDRSDASSRR